VFSLEALDGDQWLTGGCLNEETGSILMSGPVSANVFAAGDAMKTALGNE
jgi:hypothetical protein